ncbi:TPR-like protein [Gymnopus androsaceus JB14]|uniref:TPR-like protein n=1 Tax=Gymnopus androsaceus JB14 TaxID=1447944 RepID=A0A6A4HR86_9AGAR|nr:TPR-like protein [Gymnopus androsaceus JB14]
MSKLITKSKTLWGKATKKDKKETSDIPSEIAGLAPLAKSAEIIKVIVEIIEKKAENTENIKDFVQFTSRLLQILNGIVPPSGDIQKNNNLYKNFEVFQQDLENIQKTLEKLAKRTTAKAFWYAEQDGKVLAGYKEKCNGFIALLDLQLSIESYKQGVTGAESRQNATITYESIKLATPLASKVFTGRDELVTEGAEKLFKSDQAYLAIMGAGGMGKTSLALHIMEHADVKEKFQEQRHFLPCEVLPDAPSLIQGLLQILELSIPEGKDGYKILEAYLQLSQKPILLVLDNFETPWHSSKNQQAVKNLIEKIHVQRKVSIIITMRGAEGPGDIEWDKLGGKYGLPPLTVRAASNAFLSICPHMKESEELNDLLNKLDCMPLAICLMAQLAKRMPLDVLIKNWANSKTNMLRNGNQDSRLTSMNTSIDLSLKMLALHDSTSEKILPLLAYLPNGVPFWSLNLPQLCPDFGDNLEMTVMNMTDSGLIYEEGTSLKMLSPIQEYIQIKHPVTQQDLDQISNFYVQLLQNLPQNDLEAQDILEVHTRNISIVFMRQFEMAPHEAHLRAIYCFADFSKFYPQTLAILEGALSQIWNGGDQEHMEIRLKRAGIMRWMGDHEQAKLEVQKILASIGQGKSRGEHLWRFQKVSEAEIKMLAKCQQEMGKIHEGKNEYHQAIEKLTDAKSQFEKIGDQLGAAQCLQSLGDIHQMQTEYPQAIEKLTDAKSQFEKIGNQLGAAQCLQSLGDIHRMQTEYPQAIEKLTDAKSHFEKIGDQLGLHKKLTDAKSQFEKIGNQLGAAQCLRSLGDIHQMQTEYPQAIEKLTDAKSQFEKIGNQLGAAQCLQKKLTDAKSQFEKIGNQLGAARCLRSLGDIHQMQTEYPQAIEKLTDAKSQFEKIGNQLGAAQCLQSLGNIHRMQTEYPQAIEKLTDAKSQFEKIGDQLGAAQCLRSLGNIHRMQTEYPQAIEKLTDAKSQFEKIGDQLGAAQCLQSLGDIHQMQTEYPQAIEKLTDAKSQFEKIGNQLGAAQCLQSLGDIHQMQNEYPQAIEKLTDAKSQFEKIGDQLGAAQCLQILEIFIGCRNEYPQAIEKLTDAKSQFEKIGNQLGAAQCLQSLGDIHRMQTEYSQAMEKLTDAKSQFEKIGDQLGAAQCLQSLGNIHRMQTEYPQAIEKLMDAKSQFEKIGNQLGLHSACEVWEIFIGCRMNILRP